MAYPLEGVSAEGKASGVKHEITVFPAWHRQKGESIQAYGAFCAYLTIPLEDRTLKATASALGKSHSLMEKWSQWWQWRVRAAAYEEHYLLLNLESIQAKRDDMFLRHEGLGLTAISVVEAALANLVEQIDEGKLSADKLKPEALQRLLDTAVKVHRMSILGRVESAERVADQQERLAERWADELADLMRNVLGELDLTVEQQEQAKLAVSKHLVGDAAS